MKSMIVGSILLAVVTLILYVKNSTPLLYPQESECREVKDLSGQWSFILEPKNSVGYGIQNAWWSKRLSTFENATVIPVPSSYNDLFAFGSVRDHVGWVWYQREFFLPQSWSTRRVVVRFGSVNYFAAVWLNEKYVVNHTGGHLPFEAEVTEHLIFGIGSTNILTVAVNNTLSHETIPSGEFEYKNDESQYPLGYYVQTPNFDFFNYAGIHRPVWLYSTPRIFIEDITLNTDIQDKNGIVRYSIMVKNLSEIFEAGFKISASIYDLEKRKVSNEFYGLENTITVKDANFWWPRDSPNKTWGYLYSLEVKLTDIDNKLINIYRFKFGIRTVNIENGQFLINRLPFYFKGCGMHEDSMINGRGYNPAVMIKDMNLLEWIRANSFRTSHYPYSEERIMEADRRGIVVIAETPAVGLKWYTEKNLELHMKMLKELIDRDKNHPSVVMWSLANEPADLIHKDARSYFKNLSTLAKRLDKTRPLTIVYGVYDYSQDTTADLVDVISLNRYFAWYRDTGRTELIPYQLTTNLHAWYKKFQKPLLITEYGADTIAGLHQVPPFVFTEEYQLEFMSQYHSTFDQLRQKHKISLIGEMFWNFADFMTDQTITRVLGNRKGIFTRDRQPKMAAYLIRHRYARIKSLNLWKNQTTSAEELKANFYTYTDSESMKKFAYF